MSSPPPTLISNARQGRAGKLSPTFSGGGYDRSTLHSKPPLKANNAEGSINTRHSPSQQHRFPLLPPHLPQAFGRISIAMVGLLPRAWRFQFKKPAWREAAWFVLVLDWPRPSSPLLPLGTAPRRAFRVARVKAEKMGRGTHGMDRLLHRRIDVGFWRARAYSLPPDHRIAPLSSEPSLPRRRSNHFHRPPTFSSTPPPVDHAIVASSLPRPTTRRPAVLAPPALALFEPRRGRRRPTAARSTTTTNSTTEGPRREDQDVRRTGDAWPSRTPRYVVDNKLIKTPSRGADAPSTREAFCMGFLRLEFGFGGKSVLVSSSPPARLDAPVSFEPSGTPRPQGTQARKAPTLTSTSPISPFRRAPLPAPVLGSCWGCRVLYLQGPTPTRQPDARTAPPLASLSMLGLVSVLRSRRMVLLAGPTLAIYRLLLYPFRIILDPRGLLVLGHSRALFHVLRLQVPDAHLAPRRPLGTRRPHGTIFRFRLCARQRLRSILAQSAYNTHPSAPPCIGLAKIHRLHGPDARTAPRRPQGNASARVSTSSPLSRVSALKSPASASKTPTPDWHPTPTRHRLRPCFDTPRRQGTNARKALEPFRMLAFVAWRRRMFLAGSLFVSFLCDFVSRKIVLLRLDDLHNDN
ncbi:hypothetical protein DFH06DRAFT_1350748 [Mycena polygramma]|nr:hypothetical protein DFH06DRAFT_1350748 [Mycena polygramma]